MAIFDYANKRIGQCCRLKIYSTFFAQKGVENMPIWKLTPIQLQPKMDIKAAFQEIKCVV